MALSIRQWSALRATVSPVSARGHRVNGARPMDIAVRSAMMRTGLELSDTAPEPHLTQVFADQGGDVQSRRSYRRPYWRALIATPVLVMASLTLATASPAAAASTITLDSSAEGGTSGTTVTTANSGGASGTAFDNVNVGT